MPTPKQVRHHYKQCRKAFYKLQTVLNEAHRLGVINYKPVKNEKGYFNDTLESVCDSVYTAKERFEIATKDQLADAIRKEMMDELKDIY